jgi:hypothetical protein
MEYRRAGETRQLVWLSYFGYGRYRGRHSGEGQNPFSTRFGCPTLATAAIAGSNPLTMSYFGLGTSLRDLTLQTAQS